MDQKFKGICQICLRIDKKVHKTKRSNLTRFYREICKCSSEISICDPGVQCCFECEYLLMKMYHFKQKCMIASDILDSWRTSKLQEPLNTIYQKLPPTSLGLWIPENSKVFYYQEGEFATTTIKAEEQDLDIYEDTKYDELPEISDDVPSNQVPEPNKNTPILEATLTNPAPSAQESILWKCSSKNEVTPNWKVTESKTEVVSSVTMPKTGSTPSLHLPKVGKCHAASKTKQSKFESIVTESKPGNNNKLDRNGPVLCLQDIFTSLTKGIKQTENKILDDDGLHVIEDHDYCEPEGVPEPPTLRKRPRAREALKHTRIKKKAKVRKVHEKKRKEKLFSRDSFKELLIEYFSSCGELKTSNGTTIDKDFILSLVDHKLSERRMQVIWNLICARSKMSPGVRRNLGIIQNLYKNDEYESVFDIVYLKTEEEVRQEFQNRKTYKSYLNAKFKCEICYEGFTHEKRLIYHQRYHDESARSIVCDICKKRFTNGAKLSAHRPKHEIIFKCKLCPLVTIDRIPMINHFNQHKGMQYRCTLCSATFKSMSVLITHSNNSCKAALHICTICGRKFVKESVLKLHLAKDHKNEPPTDPEYCFPCPQCKMGFSTEQAMYRHCHNTHGKWLWLHPKHRKPTPRKTVEEIATQPMREYKPRKLKDRRRTCQLCKEVFESIYGLKRHFTAKHPHLEMEFFLYPTLQPHLCHTCGRLFQSLSGLFDHLNSHSGQRPYECPQCHRRFQSRPGLKQHMLFHRPRDQVCYVCGKMFKTAVILKSHMRTHKNDRRHKCHICGKGFIHSSALTRHVRVVHQKIRHVKRKPVAVASDAIELVYSENESDEIALSEQVSELHQKKRRVKKKRDEIAPELVYSENESDENDLSEDVEGVHQKIRRGKRKRDETATELVYSENESDENALGEDVKGVHEKIRRGKRKGDEIAPEMVYSENESDENALSKDVTGVHQKILRGKIKLVEVASKAKELVYRDNESDENALSEDVKGVHQKIRRGNRKLVNVASKATELVYSENESDENALSEDVKEVHQQIRRGHTKLVNFASKTTELVYSENESDENALSNVTGMHQKIRRVEKKRDEIARGDRVSIQWELERRMLE